MANEFVDDVLGIIQDDRLLGQRRTNEAPIVDLMLAYNKLTEQQGEDFEFMTDDHTGRNLKDAISKLSPKHQMVLLSDFSENMKRGTGAYGYESIKERDERVLRHRIIYACVVAVLILMVGGAFGGVVALGVLSGEFKNPIATTYFDSTLEIFKVIFSIKGKP